MPLQYLIQGQIRMLQVPINMRQTDFIQILKTGHPHGFLKKAAEILRLQPCNIIYNVHLLQGILDALQLCVFNLCQFPMRNFKAQSIPLRNITADKSVRNLQQQRLIFYGTGQGMDVSGVDQDKILFVKQKPLSLRKYAAVPRIQTGKSDQGNPDASGDKAELTLPKAQKILCEKVFAMGTPVVLLVTGESSIDIGEEAALVYIRYEGEAFEKPVKSLKYFTRVSLAAGEEKVVDFVIPKKDLMSVLEDGSREVLAGGYTLMVGTEQVRFEIL